MSRKIFQFLLALTLVLQACGGGSSINSNSAASSSSDPSESGDSTFVPSSAKHLTHDQFLELARTGELVPIKANSRAKNAAALKKREEEADQIIEKYFTEHPELKDRLRPPTLSSSVRMRRDGNIDADLKLKNGKTISVVLNGTTRRKLGIAASLQRFQNLDNQRGIYRAAYTHLPETCQKDMPSLADIEKAPLDQVMAANHKLADCYWKEGRKFGRPNPLPPPNRPTSRSGYQGAPSYELLTHGSDDSSGSSCPTDYHWDGLHKAASWTGKNYDSPVKDQGHRGTCTSFAIISALENSVARSNDQWVDLSEQSLYFHEKAIDFPDDLEDGLNQSDTIPAISESHYSIPYENVWLYNTSWDREECSDEGCEHNLEDEGDLEYYTHSCDDYSGTCSNTTHQAELVCENDDCYWLAPKDSTDSGYSVDNDYLEISCLGSDLALVALFVDIGYSVVMDFQTTEAFHAPSTSGFINDQGDDTNAGGHSIHVSGWVFNEDLPDRIPPGNGGGYFILKNSWTDCTGDMGYYYVSFDWVAENIDDASAIAPQREGTNHAPTIEITSPTKDAHLGMGGFNGPVELHATVSDQEDGTGCCKVSWSSNVDGALGTGNPLEYTFTKSGSRTVTAMATDSQGKTNTASVYFTMDNIPPVAEITVPTHDITIYTNETQRFRGNFTDQNQMGFESCSALTWTSALQTTENKVQLSQVNPSAVSANPLMNPSNTTDNTPHMQQIDNSPVVVTLPDPFPLTGCEVKAKFPTPGNRIITLTATDDQGATATDQVNVNVEAAPDTGPPSVSIDYMADSILSRSTPVTLSATVTDKDTPADPVLSYRWTVAPISRTDEIGDEIDIGTTPTVNWTPETQFPDKCSGETDHVRIRIRVFDKDGPATDYYDLYLLHSPC